MNLRTQKALTLTELLVSTVLISIVMVGVASFSFVIKQLQSTTDKSGLLSMRLAGTMNRIVRDILLTTGDPSSSGIPTSDVLGIYSICFRYDVNNPLSYGDDRWMCYYYSGSAEENILKRCDNPTTVPPVTLAQCNTATEGVQDFMRLVSENFYNVIYDTDGRLQYVEVTLTSRYDFVSPAHPINNPELVLITQVSPPNYGR